MQPKLNPLRLLKINKYHVCLFLLLLSTSTLYFIFFFSSEPPFSMSRVPVIKRKTAVLFGDSITQQSFNPVNMGWGALLSDYWTRRVDVVNRGYSGYNTKYALEIIKEVVLPQKPDLVTIFFGANDATISASDQHVPVEAYSSNLSEMIRTIKDACPDAIIIAVTNPPIWEPLLMEFNREKNKPAGFLLDRDNSKAEMYANACVKAAEEGLLGEVGGAMTEEQVAEFLQDPNAAKPPRAEFLIDGLHLNSKGNERVFQLMIELLKHHYPQWGDEEGFPMDAPHWTQLK